MKRHFCIAVFFTFIFVTVSAAAQVTTMAGHKSPAVTDEHIAMLFYKLTGQIPDFQKWIAEMPEYRNANEINRVIILERETLRLENIYGQTDMKAPVTVQFVVDLSQYSPSSKGYFITAIDEALFFTFNYLGESFALIPGDAKDYQWIDMEPEKSAEIETLLKPERTVLVELTLHPEYADPETPFDVNQENFWLILSSISEMRIWSNDENEALLWRSSTVVPYGKQNEILDLYSGGR